MRNDKLTTPEEVHLPMILLMNDALTTLDNHLPQIMVLINETLITREILLL